MPEFYIDINQFKTFISFLIIKFHLINKKTYIYISIKI